MPKILNIETSTKICSVAIANEGVLLSLKESSEGFNHASKLTILIRECLEDAKIELKDLDAIALSQGPGSYTGLRIGVSVAKGICYALNKPMIAIDTLQALALACAVKEKKDVLYCPMIDARRMEVYTAIYNFENKEASPLQALIVDEFAFSEYFQNEKTIVFCGNGSRKCKPIITSSFALFSPVICSASHLIELSKKYFEMKQFCDLAYFSPLYYKAPNITIPKKVL